MKKSKKYAVITMVHNAAFFMPIWINYYRQYLVDENIYIIDHESDDGTITENIRKRHNIITIPFEGLTKGDFLMQNISKLHAELEGKYDYIIVNDIDELIITDPDHFSSFVEYLDQSNEEHITPGTRSVIQNYTENEIDFSKPLLSQREWWFEEMNYNKPVINKKTPLWTIGFHYLCSEPGKVVDGDYLYSVIPKQNDERVILLHLRRLDFKNLKENNETFYKNQPGSEKQWEHKFWKGDDFYNWYYGIAAHKQEKIPKRFKNII